MTHLRLVALASGYAVGVAAFLLLIRGNPEIATVCYVGALVCGWLIRPTSRGGARWGVLYWFGGGVMFVAFALFPSNATAVMLPLILLGLAFQVRENRPRTR
jgi:hypothetical protein